MISVKDVLSLHKQSIQDYGGSDGIRDLGLLESAIARPFQTFSKTDLYPTVLEKAAALAESLIINHPFVDGNKRTGLLCMVGFLILNNYKMTARPEDLYQFVIDISTGSLAFDQIVDWLKNNSASSNNL